MSSSMLYTWIRDQQPNVHRAKSLPSFYRNLEEVLDRQKASHGFYTLKSSEDGLIDFSSNDVLSLGSSGLIHDAFLEELAHRPNFPIGSSGARLLDGNNAYLEHVEQEIADFHGAEVGIIVNTGWEGNCAILQAVPRPGDAVVFDELVHASMREGLKTTTAAVKLSFKHNDVYSFRDVLAEVWNTQPLIQQGIRSVLICVETIYSMDGDVCPLKELVAITKEIFPGGNAQFCVDEAHTTGVIGPDGRGLVAELGLEKEIAIRMHTFGKSLASCGGKFIFILHSLWELYTDFTCSDNTWKHDHTSSLAEFCTVNHLHYRTLVPNGGFRTCRL
jgi:8-amino-7-oxononanoate synthase